MAMLEENARAPAPTPSGVDKLDGHIVRVMDGTGDTPLSWNPDNPDEVNAARDHFNHLRSKHFNAYKMDGGQKLGEPVPDTEDFDPRAREYMLVPPTAGG